MKKLNALLCGALVISAHSFVACNDDDDIDKLNNRVTVVEGLIRDLQSQLESCIKTGASIVEATQDSKGVWTLKLSNGETIVIKGATGGGGGSAITVTEQTVNFIISIDGEEYIIPKGTKNAFASIVYSPEYADGKVMTETGSFTVNFLAKPALTADEIGRAEYDIAEAHEVRTRGGNGLFKVASVKQEGEFIQATIEADDAAQPGKSYAVALLVKLDGTEVSSNYFIVDIDPDAVIGAEEIGGYTIDPKYAPSGVDANGFESITVDGAEMAGAVDFSQIISGLDGAVFEISGAQEGAAAEKIDLLKKSLKENGAFEFAERPGTNFGETGFQIKVKVAGTIKAKINVKINDPLDGLDYAGAFTQAEAEWGGREKCLALGAQEIDIQKAITNYEEDFTIIHNGKDEFFGNWLKYAVTVKEEGDVIYNDGEKLVLGELGQKYAAKSRGLYWFNRGFAIYVPEALATEGGKYIGTNGKEYSGGEGYDYDYWGGQFDSPEIFGEDVTKWNIDITANGIIKFPATYTGYGVRLAVGAAYEYIYGVKKIGSADQLGLFFFNRRLAPDGATMPEPKP